MLRAGELSGFAASTILYQAARFLFSLAAARALSPSDLTIWALVVALLAYAPAMLLGVNNGLSRELPILIGRGAESAAQRVTAATWSATTLAVAVIAGAAGIAAALAPPVRLEALLIGGVIGATIVFGVQQFVMRSRLRFGAASLHLGVFGAGALLSTAGLALWPDADLGTALALYLVPLAVGTVLGAVLEPPVSRGIDAPEIRRLAGVGFPIMLAGLVFSLFVTMDRWIAVWLLGVEQAAPYTLAALAAAAMLVVPTVVSQQTYPRMAVALGRGSSSADLRSMARRQGLTAAVLVLPVSLLLIGGALLLPVLLPAYSDAAGPGIVLAVGFTALAFLTGYGNYLNVVGAQWRYLRAQVASALVAVPFTILGGTALGLIGIAAGMAAGHLVYGVLLWQAARQSDLERP